MHHGEEALSGARHGGGREEHHRHPGASGVGGAYHGGVKRSSSATLEQVEVAEIVNKT